VDEPTSDPEVVIEERTAGYVRYRDLDGRRWEVRGECTRLGYCLIGAVIQTPGGLVEVESLGHIEALKQELGVERIDSEMDVPVAPGFAGCCDLEVTELGA
jgi:hypothetical protein